MYYVFLFILSECILSVLLSTHWVLECPPDDRMCDKDPLGYEAILQLHAAIDDDHDGTLDRSESDEVWSVSCMIIEGSFALTLTSSLF